MQVYIQHTRNKGRGNYVFRREILIIYGFGSKNHLEKLCSNLFVAFFPQSATSVACETFVSPRSSSLRTFRNVLSDEERGETDVFAGYNVSVL